MYVLVINDNMYVKGYKKATYDIMQALKFYKRRNAEIAAKCCSDNPKGIEVKEV